MKSIFRESTKSPAYRQAPNRAGSGQAGKHQIPNKFQLPKFQIFSLHPPSPQWGEGKGEGLFRDWNLRFVWDLGFVIWNLKS
jgi:hypothetical protein